MGIGGIGSSYSYIYNSESKKISTKDGTNDEFVDYFNGDVSEETLKHLNGFDANRKRDIENMIMLFSSGVSQNKWLDGINDKNLCEISSKIVDAATSEYSIDGKKVFTAYNAISYSYDEISEFSKVTKPYKTHQSKGYDVSTNSINIAVGDIFNLGNGYKFTIKEDCIYGEGYGNGSEEEDRKLNQLIYGVNALMHFADQQGLASAMDECTPMILMLLKELGVDTRREFTINETKCEIRNGRIREVGNKQAVPKSIYNEALKRYEQELYRSLSSK